MQKLPQIREKRFISVERVKVLIAMAYAKGAADGTKHMLDVYRKGNKKYKITIQRIKTN